MVHFNKASLVALSVVALSNARPVKRIAQVIADATHDWEQACLAAGGGQQCNPLSQAAFSTLLAAPGPCAQQDAADNMIDLAHQLNNDAEMIRLTQLFRQQPRNAPDSLSTLYCQTAPRNAELNGLFNCQFAGVNPTVFTGNVQVGAAGTIPFGLNAPVNPPGACPASATPVPDGQQLEQLVQSPGTGKQVDTAPPAKSTDAAPPATSPVVNTAPAPSPAVPATAPAADSKPFTLSNGQDAQALNAKFATLTSDSACTDGDQACTDGGFAQCVGGKFVVSGCAGGTQCFALPLVNKAGTSLACTTEGDAEARIAATGATGGITGNGSAAPVSAPAAPVASPAAPVASPAVPESTPAAPAPAPAPSADANAKPFALDNGKDAQALNRKFQGLSTTSSCNLGDNACINGGFAQCVNGSFVVTGCAGGLTCAAVPLVNSRGTSIVCTTQDDALARIAASGAAGGLTGQ
ncbi:hypothetical protein EXIGLDRAFT_839377 [Exidia glandulosa HHB12029]|uniref:Carbohydrate-binding module family 19 domain-containing protein n=1 Tax=Exidia glandulosa HHB12029 TaxID=1314781 RepID=A0A165F2Z4_EXIGL|nr:hypothetical protein EXIGLDRAFT_839377 [Exidia glandulosa HHB12029]